MTTITIPRALLEQALANMVRAELLYGQPNQAIQEAIRAALSAPATAPATAPDELERLRTESEERLQNCAALVAEVERLRKDAARNPIAEEDLLALFARVQTGMRFTDADIRPFASGAAAAEFFHGIKGTP